MTFSRRSFIKTTLGAAALPTLSPIASALAQTLTNEWKTYEVVTEVSLANGANLATQSWIPLPLMADTNYFKTVSIKTETSAKTSLVKSNSGQAQFLWAEWNENSSDRTIKVTTVISTRERNQQLKKADPALKLSKEEQAFWTKGTDLLPTDGIVRQRALEITKSLPKNATDIDKAKAIYNWVVENTFRNPKTRGCGAGDVKMMLETNNLGGKCADLNAVYVALTRAAGVPARDVYGIRVADSARGYKSLGKGGDISKAQHCRAEFFAKGFGWVAVDPADVRKVILEESGGLPITDAKVVAIRDYLFGNWEMNWMAYNYDHDLLLPGSKLGDAGKIGYLMYPQAEIKGNRTDSLDPDNFKYKITSKLVA
jgi:transglutaminase-like putative cysteine protease